MSLKDRLASEASTNGHAVIDAPPGFNEPDVPFDPRDYGAVPDRQPGDDPPEEPGRLTDVGAENVRKEIERFTILQLNEGYPHLDAPAIDGLLREREVANLISTSKAGKSWLVHNLALSFATGREWLGRFPTIGGRVLLIDYELKKPTLASRLKTVAEAMEIPLNTIGDAVEVWPMRAQPMNLYELRPELEKCVGRFKLVIIDPKYRAMPPGTSENDSPQEQLFYGELDRLADVMGASFVLVHHATKGNQGDKRATDVGSGSGVQSRAVDAHIVLREHVEPDAVVLDAAVRSFAPIDPLGLRWHFPLWVPDDEIDTGSLKGQKTRQDERQSQKDAEADGSILDLCEAWRSRREIQTSTGMNTDRVNRSVARLRKARLLEMETQERRGNQCDVFRKTIIAR